ncbi:G1 family glutamic endopeptidase [Paenibacillus sp. FSL H3-0333]|uniref:G1 family glutamic endopeptidase n=1 Tax=Paenibacillus sp. FSL H3-0333 TaxID=2921373 RepID=UPI0030F9610A
MGQVNRLTRSKPCLKDKLNTGRAASSGFGWTSSNWSGYAISGKKGSYRQISADWIVPYVKPTVKPTFSSAWIGIDGFKNSSLIQTGTGHESVNGKVRYYAWWEILPASETVIPFPVSPGNHMRASIVKLSPGKWCITLRNLSKCWVFRTVQRYNGPQSSAEWIVEAPQVGFDIAPLSKLSTVCFTCCQVNGRSPRLKVSDGGIMIQNKKLLAVPSPPRSCGSAFSVRRIYHKSPPVVYSRNPIYTTP